MSDFDFQPYRDFILCDDGKRRSLYTPTDALLPLQVGMIAQREQGDQAESSPERMVKQLPVLEGLREYGLGDEREHVILAGKPGSGKSTALWQLRLALADEGLVPVLVQLKGKTTILEAIANELEKGDLELELRDIKRLLRNQKLILLLDGVNEIPTDDLRRGLAEFREQNATVPMIFTTRDLAVGGDLGIKQRLEMKPLTELQMQKFVGQRLPVDGEKLLGQLGDRLWEIAETPLFLGMLCDVFGQTGQIPENKGELFRLFDREYEKFKGLPLVSEDFRRFKSEILQHLAFVMMTGDSSKPTEFWLTIDKGVAEREIEMFLFDHHESNPASKAKEWLEDLLKHYFLKVAADASQVEFHHQLFQEYYAAEKLLSMFQAGHPDVIEDKRFQHFYLNYLKWTEPLEFLLGLLNNEAQVIRIVELGLEVDWMLGAKLSGQAKPEFHGETVVLLNKLTAREQLKFGSIKFNRKTEIPDWLKVELFKNTRSDETIAELLELVRHGDKYIYCSHKDAGYDAVQALGEIGSDEAISALCQVVQHPSLYTYWNFYAFNELAKIGEPAKNALIQISHCDEPDLRERASEILKNQEDEFRHKVLMDKLHEEYSFLNTKSQEIDVDDVDPRVDVNHMLDKIEHEDYHIRRSARHSLGEMKSYKLIPDLLKALESRSSSVHHEIARVLSLIALHSAKPKETIPALLKLLESENRSARVNAWRALGRLQCRKAIPTLLKEFECGDYQLRCELADVFSNMGCTSVIPALLEALKDEDLDVRISLRNRIMYALGNIGSERVIPALQKAFQDKDSFVRVHAVYGFRHQKLNIAIPILRKAIKDEDDRVRSGAVYVLGELVRTEAKKAEKKVKGNAVDESGCEKAADILLEAIEDKHYQVSIQAEKALGKFINDWAAHIMPSLLTLIPTINGMFAFNSIIAIQASCKFYNYDIFRVSISPIQPQIHSSGTTVNNFNGDVVTGDKVVGDKYDIQHVGNLNTGNVHIQGNQTGETP
jgi:HEAT repeat protein